MPAQIWKVFICKGNTSSNFFNSLRWYLKKRKKYLQMNVLYCSLCCCVSCWYSCSFSFLASLVWNKINTNLALNLTTLKFNRELKAKLVYSAETELEKKMLPLIPYTYFSDKGTLVDPFPNMPRAHTHTHIPCSHSSTLSLFSPLLLMHSVTSHSFTAALGLIKYHTRIQKWEKNSDVSKS